MDTLFFAAILRKKFLSEIEKPILTAGKYASCEANSDASVKYFHTSGELYF